MSKQKNNMQQLRFLGAAGSLSPGCETTSFLLGAHVLIDAGTGVGQISAEAMLEIDHVFLTHSHLDHVCGLAFLADMVCGKRVRPIVVHGLAPTLQAVRQHLFNDVIWPDFSVLPSAESPTLCWLPLDGELEVTGLTITPFAADHSVPATGYVINSGTSRILLTGDTCVSADYIYQVKTLGKLDMVVMECAFPQEQAAVSILARHTYSGSFVEFVRGVDDGEMVFFL
ncbi:3',5'-cyclic-nucleotide phosphodiesterase [Vogesella sp. LYT5W]|uniref:3',5'-cyclic-nucleotide phosphodiesterase n=1 Tax=Vogesella margarita TaxID=2984199 RepID=A0ABT5IM78_9NEIS|nr:3',5'-cyclic-nucleotide phosphodiesterase [Vogesella margarita]MDC7713637.1 3',5'-cyclic-nucleotide phosphodiesterase [Vogesella margarita]